MVVVEERFGTESQIFCKCATIGSQAPVWREGAMLDSEMFDSVVFDQWLFGCGGLLYLNRQCDAVYMTAACVPAHHTLGWRNQLRMQCYNSRVRFNCSSVA